MQEKADKRAHRIVKNMSSDYVCYFFLLSYMDDYVPFFFRNDLEYTYKSEKNVDVYRLKDVYWFYNRHTREYELRKNDDGVFLDSYSYNFYQENEFDSFELLSHERVACLYYPDVQNFFKKLRNLITRNELYKPLFDKNYPLRYFVTGEYGETYQRSHWHVLLWVPKTTNDFKLWSSAVVRCWQYADERITLDPEKGFQEARCPASYVSSYVNCSADISPFLQRDDFKPVWHYSENFGFNDSSFTLRSILDGFKQDSICYNETITQNGVSKIINIPLPSYVTNRYFPTFKGRCYLNYNEIFDLLSKPCRIFERTYREKMMLDFSDCYKFIEKMRSLFIRFEYERTFFKSQSLKILCFDKYILYKNYSSQITLDYAESYLKCMQLRNNIAWRQKFTIVDDYDYYQYNYNILEFMRSKPHLFYMSYPRIFKKEHLKYIVLPNDFERVRSRHIYYEDKFYKKIKQKKLNSLYG